MIALIIPFPGWGQLLAIYKLAHNLEQENYKVVIASSERFRQSIIDNGFEPLIYPFDTESGAKKKNIQIRSFYMKMKERDAVINDLIDKLLAFNPPAIVFIDAGIIRVAFPFLHRSVPVIMFSTSLTNDYGPNNPPFCSGMIPTFSKWNSIRVLLVWQLWYLRKKLFFLEPEIFSLGHFDYNLKRICQRYALDTGILDKQRVWNIGFRYVPEIYFYPEEFDFSPGIKKNKFFVGPMLDIDRNEDHFKSDFSWDKIRLNEFIICCSLGTLARFYKKDIDTFYRKLISIFAARPNWTLIISVGSNSCIKTEERSDNVFIFESIPQLSVLKRSHLMINHAGIGSVKECILSGVPMLAFPIDSRVDQNGCAARIKYHGIGIKGNYKRDSKMTICRKIETLLYDPLYKKNVLYWKDIFERPQPKSSLTSIIEKANYGAWKI